MLALVWGIHQFHPYLYGRAFKARTDRNSLKWLHSFREPEGQVASGWNSCLSTTSKSSIAQVCNTGMQMLSPEAHANSVAKVKKSWLI